MNRTTSGIVLSEFVLSRDPLYLENRIVREPCKRRSDCIVYTYICIIFIALTVFAINLTCILCTLSYNMTLSIANYETAKSKSHHVCRWQWFCRKKGRRGHFPKCPKQHKTFMYVLRKKLPPLV